MSFFFKTFSSFLVLLLRSLNQAFIWRHILYIPLILAEKVSSHSGFETLTLVLELLTDRHLIPAFYSTYKTFLISDVEETEPAVKQCLRRTEFLCINWLKLDFKIGETIGNGDLWRKEKLLRFHQLYNRFRFKMLPLLLQELKLSFLDIFEGNKCIFDTWEPLWKFFTIQFVYKSFPKIL